jgi:hypothetical protein
VVQPSTTLTEERREPEDRTVLLKLELNKSAVVRDAKVIRGPEALRSDAIKAAKSRKYTDWIVASFPDPQQLFVEVDFPQNKHKPPEVRPTVWGGVPSCLPPSVARVLPEVMQTHLLQRVDPVYPTEIQQVAGVLVLQVSVDKRGNVTEVRKVSGPDAFVAAAVAAVKQWKYEPFRLIGEPIAVETRVELRFPR